MSYLVLARKWRPQQFAEILGQEHVTRTLTNALDSGRIAHAFLFTGARGVGKTSAARILAKALCCEAQAEPSATPCGDCPACTEIAESRATDVIEIDAASNTGVANVREIIDNVRYLPGKTRFKIYIIDEVHMLSTGAFNALLKTLEEPPPHVKFILATTDVHKIPVTILSRCQRYDFRRIPLREISARLSEILKAESHEHDASSLNLIARESEGSMRDAQSLLEQVLTFADGRTLTADLLRSSLGVADRAVLSDMITALTTKQPGQVLELVKTVHDRGLDLKRFAEALIEYSRDLLVASLVDDPNRILDRPSDEITGLVTQAQALDAVTLQRLFEELCKIVQRIGPSAYPRFTLEIGLASLAESPSRVPVSELLSKLNEIDIKLSGAGGARNAPDTGRGAASGGAAPSRPFRRSW
jgi:DNA polymerase-3 subunit gamma/tau